MRVYVVTLQWNFLDLISHTRHVCSLNTTEKENGEMVDMLKNFWEIESLGIADTEPKDQLPMKVKQIERVSFNGNHYKVRDTITVLHRNLMTEPNLLIEYDKIIQDQEQNGIVEKVPELNTANNPLNAKGTHYSLHYAVVQRDRETTGFASYTMDQQKIQKKNGR